MQSGTVDEEDQGSKYAGWVEQFQLRHLLFHRQLLDKIEELQKTISDMTIHTQELESALALTHISAVTAGMIPPQKNPECPGVSNESIGQQLSTAEDAEYDALIAQMQLKAVGADSTRVPEHLFGSLVTCLPPRPRAVWLCQLYVDFPWFFCAFSRQEMAEEIFAKVYDNADRVSHLRQRPHLLAVIYLIFAVASTFDPSAPADNESARTYFRLGTQCLNLRCLGSSKDLDSVQAIGLLSQFQSVTAEKEQSDGAWFYGSMAVKLATKVCRCWRIHPTN